MQWIDREKLKSDVLAGTFLNLGSLAAVEIAAETGFDWLLIDLEHGCGSLADLRALLVACRKSAASPIVRIRSVDPDTVKFVMDSGAAGVMFPYVSSREEAEAAVRCMKYAPQGNRGVANAIRATDFGVNWSEYFHAANSRSLVVTQIENAEAVEAAEDIAAVDGVDVLFVGPLDLSVNLGHPGDFGAPAVVEAMKKVIAACESCGKVPGILTRPEYLEAHRDLGFRFVAVGSDIGAVSAGLKNSLEMIRRTT